MTTIELELPTFSGGEFDESRKRKATVLANPDHIRVVLDDAGTYEEHDIYIERQDGFWLVLFHPNGSDPLVGLEIHPTTVRVESYDSRPQGELLCESEIETPVLPTGYDK